jgi:hypothetical protein
MGWPPPVLGSLSRDFFCPTWKGAKTIPVN